MKKLLIILISIFSIHSTTWAQPHGDPVDYLVKDQSFINWVSATAINQIEIYLNFKEQLGSRLSDFKKEFAQVETDEQLNQFLHHSAFDPEFSYDKIATYILEGMILRQNNEWLWQMEESKQIEIVHQAFLLGMRSSDPEWKKLTDKLNGLVISEGAPAKSIASTIASCLWDTIGDAFSVVTGVTALIADINNGNFNAALAEIKGILKKSGRKFGWFGLAWAALDVGICIWNNV